MDFRNEMRRDPYARSGERIAPAFAPGGVPSGGRPMRPCPMRPVAGGVQQAINTLPLAMVYVPEQRFEGIKDVACALAAGTVFDALDLPFAGCRTRGGGR